MPRYTGLLLALCLLFGSAGQALAQQNSDQATPPPKVLVMIREFLKPGKSGSPHLKTESAFVNAFAAAKWPTHYLAADSLSGPPRSLFFVGFESFAAWEKDNMATQSNAGLAAELDRASIADGDLLSAYESSTFVYRDDYSFNPNVKIAEMRYFEISRFRVKPGHEKDWEAIVNTYKSAYGKAIPNAHWAVYEDMYGRESGGVYLVIVPMKSAAEVDQNLADSKKFASAVGEEGMKRLSELSAAAIDTIESNLFMFNPKISYVSDDWVKADPSFWKPSAPAAGKKAPAKPTQ